MNKILAHLYYSPPQPSALAGGDKLSQAARRKKIKHNAVIKWLESQDAYNRHKPIRRRFSRRHYDIKNQDDYWEADLADLRSLATYNDNYNYLLIVIDVLSKFSWVEPIINKTSKAVAEAFQKILSRSSPRNPVCLQTDAGKEFLGQEMQRVLKKNNIQFRVARSPDIKAAVAERFIRTLKGRLWRYFTYTKNYRYLDVLQKIVESYNNTIHSAIKMTPASVTLQNANIARKNLNRRYGQKAHKPPRYKVGDLVRVSRAKSAFDKGYEGGWTEEIFKIERISASRPPHVYILKDLREEEIEGIFYEEEICRVRKDLNNEIWEIDEILETVGKGRSKKYLVSWKGYPKSFNSYVYARDLKVSK